MNLQEIKNAIGAKPYYENSNGVLYCADCIEVMAKMPNKCVDAIISDPPYGINFCSSRTSRKDFIKNDSLEDWQAMLPPMLENFKRVISDSGCCCCCCGGGGKTPVTSIFTLEAIKYFNLIQTLVWKKTIGLGWRYRPSYENILILSKDKDKYAFYDTSKKCSNVIEGINQDIPVYAGNEAGKFDDHPTKKPVELMIKLLKTHTKENDIVLEPFAGGGSTLIACERLGRRWIGLELQEKYCKVAAARIASENNQLKLFV